MSIKAELQRSVLLVQPVRLAFDERVLAPRLIRPACVVSDVRP